MAEKGALLSTVGQNPRINPDAPSDAAIVFSACAVPCTLTSCCDTLCASTTGLSIMLFCDAAQAKNASSLLIYLVLHAGCAYILHPGLDYCHWTCDCSCNASGDATRHECLKWAKPTILVSSSLRVKVVDSILDEFQRQEMHTHTNS